MNISTTPKTQYGYASGSANTVRPTSLTYPNGRVLNYSYGTSGGINDNASRVAAIVDSDTTTLVSYDYLGRGSFVQGTSPQPQLKWTLASLTGTNDPDTGDIYTGLDCFGRVKDNRWYSDGTSSDVDRIQYGYDRARATEAADRSGRDKAEGGSSVKCRYNAVATAQGKAFDELYTYDGVQRLKDMARGTLNGTKTALTTSTFGQCWTLDATGNWGGFREDSDGNGTWDLVQSRTANKVNEITGVTNSTGAAWATPAYSAAGNMTTIPRGGQAGSKNWSGLSLDDWSGLSTDDWSTMTVNASSGATSFTATYDAWNRLIKLIDPESGATIQRNTYDARRFRIVREDFGEPPRHFYYNTGWQCLEERASSTPDAALPDRQFIWGLRYIDELVLRDRDTDGNGSLNERLHALQDGNWNVTALVDTTGTVQERYAYSAYGVPQFLAPTFSTGDKSAFDAELLYCGYRWERQSGIFHVRNRYYSPRLGLWILRDPFGQLDGPDLYTLFEVPNSTDPYGLSVWEENWVLAGLHGFFVTGWYNIGTGVWRGGEEVGYIIADDVGMLWDPINYQAQSSAGNALDQCVISSGQYCKEFLLNTATFGVKGQCDALSEYCSGEITADEASQRIGSVGIMQLGGAAGMYRQGGFATRPINRQVAVDIYNAAAGKGLPVGWDLSPGAVARLEQDALYNRCLKAARISPDRYGRKRTYELAIGSRGQSVVANSGRLPGSDLPFGLEYPTGIRHTSCAMPRAAAACGPDPVMQAVTSGVRMEKSFFFGRCMGRRAQYMPACNRCRSIISRNGFIEVPPPRLIGPLDFPWLHVIPCPANQR